MFIKDENEHLDFMVKLNPKSKAKFLVVTDKHLDHFDTYSLKYKIVRKVVCLPQYQNFYNISIPKKEYRFALNLYDEMETLYQRVKRAILPNLSSTANHRRK